jgi:hypothetical protein
MSQEGINAPRPNIFLTKTVGEFPTALRNFIKRVRGLEVRGSRGNTYKRGGEGERYLQGGKGSAKLQRPNIGK